MLLNRYMWIILKRIVSFYNKGGYELQSTQYKSRTGKKKYIYIKKIRYVEIEHKLYLNFLRIFSQRFGLEGLYKH